MNDDVFSPHLMRGLEGLGAAPASRAGVVSRVGASGARMNPTFDRVLWAWYSYDGLMPTGNPQQVIGWQSIQPAASNPPPIGGQWVRVTQLGPKGAVQYGPTFKLPAWVWYPLPGQTLCIGPSTDHMVPVLNTNGVRPGPAPSSVNLFEMFPGYFVAENMWQAGGVPLGSIPAPAFGLGPLGPAPAR